MLILTRKQGESIIIDGNIKIEFLGVCKKRYARLGITAPANISVHREEIQERINAENGVDNHERF